MKPKGLSFYQNILPETLLNEVHKYLSKLKSNPYFNSIGQTKNANLRRKVIQFGYEYVYSTHSVRKLDREIPSLLLKMINYIEYPNKITINQCIINEYLPGDGISAHIDAECFGPAIFCFSFGTEGIMVFTNQTSHDLYYQQVPNNSLYTMERESRYVWKHEMLNLGSKGKRYVAENPISDGNSRFSITFRIV